MILSGTQEPVPTSSSAPAVDPTSKLTTSAADAMYVLPGALRFLLMLGRLNIPRIYLEKSSPFDLFPERGKKKKNIKTSQKSSFLKRSGMKRH